MKAVAPILAALLLTHCASPRGQLGPAQEPQAPAQGRAETKAPAAEDADPLVVLNKAFREEYARAKTEALARGGPVVVVTGSKLVLLRNNAQVAEAPIRSELYHRLKAISHIPLALYVMLAPSADEPLSPERNASLRRFRGLMLAAREELKEPVFPAALLDRQQRILDASLRLLDGALQENRVSQKQLGAFAAELGPIVLANAADAAAAQLERLHARMTEWRKELSPEDWKALHVVIISAHMPRDGEVTWQYFSRLLGEPVEGRRIIYAESQWEMKNALDLLATHVVDEDAGGAFFGEPMRMHRDLLADAARAWLDAHPVQP